MPKLVTHGAKLECSEGLSPSALSVPAASGTDADEAPAATVMDFQPMVNIASFGRCKALANPEVAAASAAAKGVVTPMPCVPVITAPWSPGASVVTVSEQKALTADSTCRCAWAGSIRVIDPGSDIEAD
ncbi:DUF4280 domain-containing protein [Sorangium sp. So ce117]|uniref:DUF4280 domain-containing protein n=1 Tax=Sorangium sp. So ce117 TaxID=3133277 RepID=UPI003F5FE738